jgi:hypothetical protein
LTQTAIFTILKVTCKEGSNSARPSTFGISDEEVQMIQVQSSMIQVQVQSAGFTVSKSYFKLMQGLVLGNSFY